ncbi:MAG: exo-alpha-sialidase [Bacteroidales bacterium]|nr:exo-alpha-sialidase [Bacteroidales bacterium]
MKNHAIKYIILFLVLVDCDNKIDELSSKVTELHAQSVEIIQKQIPVLTLKEGNPVLIMKINAGKTNAKVNEINIDLTGTSDLKDLENIKIFYRGENLQDSIQFGKTLSPSQKLSFKGKLSLTSDSGYFSVIVKLKDNADILHSMVVRCTDMKTSDATIIPDAKYEPLKLRFGTALCQHFEDGVHTYRIPGIVRTNNGTLLAIFDRRLEARRDPQGVVNIGLKRSTNGGKTWDPVRVILDRGSWGGLHPRMNGITDACIIVNTENNDIFVGALWMHGQWVNGVWEGEPGDPNAELGRKKGSMPGMTEKETCQFLLTKSTDDGITWSEAINMTKIKKPEWRLYALSPTNGITLEDGTLVFPSKVPGNVSLTYSKDGGQTWKVSNLGPKTNGVENAIVQLDDGSIMLNARRMGESSYRTVYTTPDLGKTWIEHHTNSTVLAGPGCLGSLYKHIYYLNGEKKSILFFSNPNSKNKREMITIRASFDEGTTWPEKNWILLDEEIGAYSSITSVDDQTIGIMYEGSQSDITFQKIAITEFIK